MGRFDNLKIYFMSDEEMAELASNQNTPKEKLIKLCKHGNTKVLEAAATNPNTPREVLLEELIKLITDRKRNVRESAIEVIDKLRNEKNLDNELYLKLSVMLTQLLKSSDWIKSSDIVKALGLLGSSISTDTICNLMHIALRDADMYNTQEWSHFAASGNLQQVYMKTDTEMDR